MSELCREVFEKHQAKLLNMDYQELKEQFDRHETCFSKRYATFSDFEKEFELWQAAWNVRQTELDHLKGMNQRYIGKMQEQQDQVATLKNQLSLQRDRNKALETELTSSRNYGDGLQKRIDGALSALKCFWAKDGDPDFVVVVDAEKTLRGEHE